MRQSAWIVGTSVVLGVGLAAGMAWSEPYERPRSSDDFDRAANVDQYLEGRISYTTLTMIRNVGTALHQDQLKTQAEVTELRKDVQALADEVRRLSSRSHKP